MWEELGQATVEYVLVGLVLLAMIVAIAALWRYGSDGGLTDLIGASSSHALASPEGILDVVLY